MKNKKEILNVPSLRVEVWSPNLTQSQIDKIKLPFRLPLVLTDEVMNDIRRMSEMDTDEFGNRYGMNYNEAAEYVVYNLNSVVCVLRDEMTGVIEGFTIAIPARDAYQYNDVYSDRTHENNIAYVVSTVIDPKLRGLKLVGKLMQKLEKTLKSKGYRFIDRDARDVDLDGLGSYADKIIKNAGKKVVINQKFDTPLGPQRYIRTRI
ncbi:MAG: hypothetical protein H6773_01595 [Pseudomonadales bacterium]|nr:hypothetical protein [Pseudomonadales bacterium]